MVRENNVTLAYQDTKNEQGEHPDRQESRKLTLGKGGRFYHVKMSIAANITRATHLAGDLELPRPE
jgi:hypothetical protein